MSNRADDQPARRRMRLALTRREFLADGATTPAAAVVIPRLALPSVRARTGASASALTQRQRRTLDAALARVIPAEQDGDWSAADVGAGDYVESLLAGTGDIYAGGPYRRRFRFFQRLSRVKELGWERDIRRLRKLYASGLADLDSRAGGDFAAASPEEQDGILEQVDYAGSEFFAVLYAHTMEGVYSHPVYGGNRDYRAWKEFAYQGDVHGVRFPGIGPADAPWNVYGG